MLMMPSDVDADQSGSAQTVLHTHAGENLPVGTGQ